jgi:hypothetical protein
MPTGVGALVALAIVFAAVGPGSALAAGPRTITTIAGSPTGLYGFGGDGGPASAAFLDTPTAVAVDAQGAVFVSDRDNHRIRRIGPEGTITTIAGSGVTGYLGDGGPATSARLSPIGVMVDGKGNVYISDCEHDVVRKVVPAGTITTIAGTGISGFSGDGGPATAAKLNCPASLALDSEENLYIADSGNRYVRKVSAGAITTVAGNGFSSPSGDGGPATSASFTPIAIALDSEDDLYIADGWAGNVRKVTNGIITTFAGNGSIFTSGDGGPATAAGLQYPAGVAADKDGNVFIMTNCRLREVDTGGTIRTIAGTEFCGLSGDGCAATSAQFLLGNNGVMNPLVVDGEGNLLFADYSANNVRKVLTTEPPASCSAGPEEPKATPKTAPKTVPKARNPPLVRILSGPAAETAEQRAIFTFKGVTGGAYECSIDNGAWAACRSGQDFGPLAPGDHLFRVRETLDGLTGPVASYRWTIAMPRACVLRVARARVFAYTRKQKIRLVIRYTAYHPADVTVSYGLSGSKGKLALGSASSHFDLAGVFRLPETLSGKEAGKVRAAQLITVRFKVSGAPQSCGRYYTKQLTIPQTISGQTVWFQSDSVFAR